MLAAACCTASVGVPVHLVHRSGHRHRADRPPGVADRSGHAHQPVVGLVDVASDPRRADLIEVGPQRIGFGDRVLGAPRQGGLHDSIGRSVVEGQHRLAETGAVGRHPTAEARRQGEPAQHDPFQIDDLASVEHPELHGQPGSGRRARAGAGTRCRGVGCVGGPDHPARTAACRRGSRCCGRARANPARATARPGGARSTSAGWRAGSGRRRVSTCSPMSKASMIAAIRPRTVRPSSRSPTVRHRRHNAGHVMSIVIVLIPQSGLAQHTGVPLGPKPFRPIGTNYSMRQRGPRWTPPRAKRSTSPPPARGP